MPKKKSLRIRGGLELAKSASGLPGTGISYEVYHYITGKDGFYDGLTTTPATGTDSLDIYDGYISMFADVLTRVV